MSRYFTKTLASLEPYTPGEQLKIADIVKLNANENPYPLHHWVAAVVDLDHAGIVHSGAAVVVLHRHGGQGTQRVQLRHGGGGGRGGAGAAAVL